ncbi:retroelement silencing factor 1 isoform X2 [Oryctolagus cuniculus]|uniref:retroelement silencing factor 1 isoform X2 n=1 Tax=Oryctolagus cuniculus TaxID=9986 RepID=UPI003879809C
MNWNAKPESAPLPPPYSKSQPFLQQSLISQLLNPSQSSVGYPGNQEACMYPGNSSSVSQPPPSIRNYKTPRQVPIPDAYNRTVVTSQTSVERMTFANVRGLKQPSHNLPVSSGVTQNVWVTSPVRVSVPSHSGASASHHSGLGAGASSVHVLQSQHVTSDAYSMRLQGVPSNSGRGPAGFQGNQGLNQCLSEQQVDWSQQYGSNNSTYPSYRPLPRQHNYSPHNFLQDPPVQKQNLEPPVLLQIVPSPSLQVKNLPNPSLTSQPKQTATTPSYHCAAQTERRLPPLLPRPPPPPAQPPLPPSYPCRYASQPSPSTQPVNRLLSVEVPQSQETYPPGMQKDAYRGFQQQWQNTSENVTTGGKFCGLKLNTNVKQPFIEPVRPSAPSVQALGQNNQEKRTDSCNSAPDPVLDTYITKEKLVRDIKTLVEIKRKFSELARKIKINKDLLMAAGCSKITNTGYSEPGKKSELHLKETAKIQPSPQPTLVAPEGSGGHPAAVGPAEDTRRTHCRVNPAIQEINCKELDQVNSVCVQELPVPDQVHDLKVLTLKTPGADVTQAAPSNTQLPSENFVAVEQNTPAVSETISVPQTVPYGAYVHQNKLHLNLLAQNEETQSKLLKIAPQMIQDSKADSSEVNPNTQITDNQLTLKTGAVPGISNVNAEALGNSLCLERQSSSEGILGQSQCSVELLATCLSLWKKQPPEAVEDEQSGTNRKAVGISKPVEVCVRGSVAGNSQNRVNSQESVLSALLQNHESTSINVTKGTELQIAVVTPLILSDVKTLSQVKEVTPDTSPDVYPVIKEGSVCSLQSRMTENPRLPTALKVDAVGPAASTATSTKIFPLMEKEKHKGAPGSVEGTPATDKGGAEPEPGVRCPPSAHETSFEWSKSSAVSDMLQIDSICSLVEGDTSYNSQIAKIFNCSPLRKVEPQEICVPSQEVTSSSQQKEQLDYAAEDDGFGFQKDKLIQGADVSPEEVRPPEPLRPPELPSSEFLEARGGVAKTSSLERASQTESTAMPQDACPRETDVVGRFSAQDPPSHELDDDKTPVWYLQDQLSELLREFPYGIEAVSTRECCVHKQMTPGISDRTCDKTTEDGDSKDSADRIQITVLSSEQMKELFPEQDEEPPDDVVRVTETEQEKPVLEAGNPSDLETPAKGQSSDSVTLDSEKDSVHCCAWGWLSMVYEGVPQCRCNSIKNSVPVEEKGRDGGPPLETTSCKQSEGASATDGPVTVLADLPSDPNVTLTRGEEKGEEKGDLPETQGSTTKDPASMKQSTPEWTAKEDIDEFSPKCDRDDTKDRSQSNQNDSTKGRSQSKQKNLPRTEQEPSGQFSPGCENSSTKGASQSKQGSSLRAEGESSGQGSSKCGSNKLKDRSQTKEKGSLKTELSARCDSSNTKGASHSKQSSPSLRTEQDPAGHGSSKCDKKPDPLPSHKKKRKLKFHEVTFHSTNKMTAFCEKASQGNLRKKTQTPGSVKAVTGFVMHKDQCSRGGSGMQSVSPEKTKFKFKAGGSRLKYLEKRKLDVGHVLDNEVKKKKCDGQEQDRHVGSAPSPGDTTSSPHERTSVQEKTAAPTATSSDLKHGSSKFKRVITAKEYLQRQKLKEAVGSKAPKETGEKVVPSESEHTTPSRPQPLAGRCGKSSERHSSGGLTFKESSSTSASRIKNLKSPHSEESKTHSISKSSKGKADGKQPDKMSVDKTKPDKELTHVNSDVEFSPVPPQAKDQRKSYLNRVAFKCTERESICLSKLENSPRRLSDKEQRQDDKPAVKETTEKLSMLEFKLCPDVLLKNTKPGEERKDQKPHVKEQAPVQDVNPRLCKRSISALGFETLQNPAKDSKAMFQTYKQMYLEKRSRSLGSSPVT